MAVVGIPRALIYYQYYPMWKTFFEGLGAEVVTSEPTIRGMVISGSARMVADTCLPVKVFCGHALALVGKCDFIFIPSIRSLEKDVYNCSKFLGLPDMIKAVAPECPPIIEPDIDLSKGQRDFYLALYSLSSAITRNPIKVKQAAEAAWEVHKSYRGLMQDKGLPQAIATFHNGSSEAATPQLADPVATIAVIGHPYVIYDDYINHRLLYRLTSMGVKVMTAEMASEEELGKGVERLAGRPYWTYEDEIVGAGGHYLTSEALPADRRVDGVISVTAFGCGPDSVMIDVVQRYAKGRRHTPYMALTIDEHTGEAGLVTRLEAFVDMLLRRKMAALKV